MLSPDEARAAAERLVERAIRAGADAADALYAGQRSNSVEVRLGELEHVGRSEDEEIGLRLFVGSRIGVGRLLGPVGRGARRAW
jgi:PmbA protein